MGIFDIFSSGNSSVKQLEKIKNELERLTGKLEAVSVSLDEQSQQIKSLPIDQLSQKVEDIIEHQKKHQAHANDTAALYEQLKQMIPGSEEIQQQAEFVKMNMAAFNMILELDLKDANSNLKAFQAFCYEFAKPTTSINELTTEIPALKESAQKLIRDIESIEKTQG